MRRKVLFVCATDDEFSAIKEFVADKPSFIVSSDDVDLYICNDIECYIVKVGISYFNAATLLSFVKLIKPSAVYNVGSCAGLLGQKMGTVIVSNNCYCNDLDLTAFGAPLGRLPYSAPVLEYGDPIVSGSKFLNSEEEVEQVKAKFPGACAFDMESFMMNHICAEQHIPFLSVRGVSDSGDSGAKDAFEKAVKVATRMSFVYALGLESEETLSSRLSKGRNR